MKRFVAGLLLVALTSCADFGTLLDKQATAQQRAIAAINLTENGLKMTIAPGIVTWLQLEKNPAQRAKDAAWVYSAANALYAASTGAQISPDSLKQMIATFANGEPRYLSLSNTLLADYGSVYGSFQIAKTSPAQFLSTIASLASQAAQPFLSPAAPTT